MSSAAHELRVLDGLHAGARAPLQGDSAVRLAIGSALDNDIVLSDPGIDERHAVLQWDAAAGRWHLLADAGSEPGHGHGHAPGEAVAVGPVRVTVAAANDAFDLQAGPAEPEPALVADPLPDDDTTTDAEPTAAPRRRWLRVLLLGTGLLALLVAAGLWQFRQGAGGEQASADRTPAPAAARPAPKPAAAPAADQRTAVRAVLKAQGLDTRLQVQGSPARPVVTGLLGDAATLEMLANGLARLSPRPGLQVWTLDQVRGALRDGGLKLPPLLRMGIDDQGALQLGGPVPSDAAAIDLQQRVQAVLPPGVPVRAQFDTPQRLAARVVADGQAQGFRVDGRLEGQPGSQRLALTVDLPEADRPRWELWLTGVHKQLAGALSFTATLRAAPPPPRSDQRLPFRVRSIVGGLSPYLVLADGAQLVPGGQHGDVTLLQIDDDALVLQRAGQTFKVPR